MTHLRVVAGGGVRGLTCEGLRKGSGGLREVGLTECDGRWRVKGVDEIMKMRGKDA